MYRVKRLSCYRINPRKRIGSHRFIQISKGCGAKNQKIYRQDVHGVMDVAVGCLYVKQHRLEI